MGSHLTQEQVDDLRGERRWPPAIVLCLAIAAPLLLPDRFSLVSKWIEPALLALLLVAHIIADPGRIDRQVTCHSHDRRRAARRTRRGARQHKRSC